MKPNGSIFFGKICTTYAQRLVTSSMNFSFFENTIFLIFIFSGASAFGRPLSSVARGSLLRKCSFGARDIICCCMLVLLLSLSASACSIYISANLFARGLSSSGSGIAFLTISSSYAGSRGNLLVLRKSSTIHLTVVLSHRRLEISVQNCSSNILPRRHSSSM